MSLVYDATDGGNLCLSGIHRFANRTSLQGK
jgi:hypothetical protein